MENKISLSENVPSLERIIIDANRFIGAKPVAQALWENQIWTDPPAAVCVRPGKRIKANFNGGLRPAPYFQLVLYGFPGIHMQPDFDRHYIDLRSIFIHFKIRLEGRIVHDGPVFLRNHGHCGYGQFTYLEFPWDKELAAKRRLNIVIETRSRASEFPGFDEYHLIRAEIRPSSGRLINDLYCPDPLDLKLEESVRTTVFPGLPDGAGGLLCGAGYELETNREVPKVIDAVADDRIGNYLMFRLDTALNDGCTATADDLVAWAKRCAERRIYFSVMLFRAAGHAFTTATARRMKKAAGEYFFSVHVHELGLIAFGRKAWIEPFLHGEVQDLADGWRTYARGVRARLAELPPIGLPRGASESGLTSARNLRNGADIPLAEIYAVTTMPTIHSVRGAARAHGRKLWGAHMPFLWSFGNAPLYPHDRSFIRRQELANKLAYLCGGRLLYPESGLFYNVPSYYLSGSSRRLQDEGFREPDDQFQKALRQTFRNIRRLHCVHKPPADPETPFAFLQGEHDSFCGSLRGNLAFQRTGLAPAYADRGWDLLDVFSPGVKLTNTPRPRFRHWFAGSPFGQLDIVPTDMASDQLSRYRLLVIPGWNTMGAALYRRLTDYVVNGGTLFLAAPQFRTDVKDKPSPQLFRSGRVEDLCGLRLLGPGNEIMSGKMKGSGHDGLPPSHTFLVKNSLYSLDNVTNATNKLVPRSWRVDLRGADVLYEESESGEPLLVRHRLGKGTVHMLTTWDYPGHPVLLEFSRLILRALAGAVELPLTVHSAPTVQWFHYREGGSDLIAVVDTDWREEARALQFTVSTGDREAVFGLATHRARFVSHCAGIFASARNEECSVRISQVGNRTLKLVFFGVGHHEIEIAHPGKLLRITDAPWVKVFRQKKGRTILSCKLDGIAELEFSSNSK